MPSVGQLVAVVLDWVWHLRPFLPVDHQMIQVDDSARSVIVAVVLWIVAEVAVGDVNLVTVGFVVTQFVNGIGHVSASTTRKSGV